MTMCGMVYIPHAVDVATNDMVDILPTFGVMGGDLKATIENLEVINSRLILCYNELHNVFLVKMFS